MFKLFRTGECRRADESIMGQRLRIGFRVKSFGQTEIDYFYHSFSRSCGRRDAVRRLQERRDIVVTACSLCRGPDRFRHFAIGRDEH